LPLKSISKTFYFSRENLINLVLDIDEYKKFLPWCVDSKILASEDKNNEKIINADLTIGYKRFIDTYTSKVIYNKKNHEIDVSCIKGNLKKLVNIWRFKEVNSKECIIDFLIEIELEGILKNFLLNKFFDYGFEKILKSFEDQAYKTIKPKF